MISQILPRLLGASRVRLVTKDGACTETAENSVSGVTDALLVIEPEAIELQVNNNITMRYALDMLEFACRRHNVELVTKHTVRIGNFSWTCLSIAGPDMLFSGVLIVDGQTVDCFLAPSSGPS